MKRRVQGWLAQLDVDVRRRHNVPFGVRWEDDLRLLLGDRAPRATLIDVGANIGQTARSLAGTFPEATIYSFEPVPSLFVQLQRNTTALGGVTGINAALGAAVGQGLITTDRDGQNTLLAGVPSSGSTSVPVNTLDAFCRSRGLTRLELLKIDTEGYETAVLEGAAGLFSQNRIDFVLAECDFHRRADEPHGDFFEIHALMAAHGFCVVGFYSGGVDEQGWVWGDVLMMRVGAVEPRTVLCSPYGG